MEAGKVIYNLLSGSTAVHAICADRVYPEVAHQTDTMPFVVYTIESANPSGTKSGGSTIDVVQFDVVCMSKDYAQCMDLGTAVRGALDRIGGMIGGVPVQSIDFQSQGVDYDYSTDAHAIVQTYQMRLQFTGTVNEYAAIYTRPTYEVIEAIMSPQQMQGGSSEVTFSGASTFVVPFSVEYLNSTSDFGLNSGSWIDVTGDGYYRLTASVTFSAGNQNLSPHIWFQVGTRTGNSHGVAYIKGQSHHASAFISEMTEIDGPTRIFVMAKEDTDSTHDVSFEYATFSIERVVQS